MVAVALLILITMVLAGIYGGLFISLGDQLTDPAPNVAFEVSYDRAGDGNGGRPYFNVTHDGGEEVDASTLVIRDDAGNEVGWADAWAGGDTISQGASIRVDGDGSDGALKLICSAGQTYSIVYQAGAGRESVVLEYEIPENPDPIPAWC